MKLFEDDDAAYIRWVKDHPIGYVLNTTRPALPNFLILHLASCPAISGDLGLGNYWTADSIKACADEREELEDWAQHEIGGRVNDCILCRP